MKEEVLNPVHHEAQGTSCLSFSPDRVDKCGATCHAPASHTTCWARAPGEQEDALHSLTLSQHTLSSSHCSASPLRDIHLHARIYGKHINLSGPGRPRQSRCSDTHSSSCQGQRNGKDESNWGRHGGALVSTVSSGTCYTLTVTLKILPFTAGDLGQYLCWENYTYSGISCMCLKVYHVF